MGSIDTSSSRPLKLRLNKGVLICWDPDTNQTTTHKGWEGWFMDWAHKDNSDHQDPRFRKPSVVLQLHDGQREAHLEVPLVSGSFSQFMCHAEHINWRQPVIIRPWTTKEGKTGGVNVYQGGIQIAPKYTRKNLNGMPPMAEHINELTKEKTVDSTEQLKFLLAIMDGPVRATINEVKQMEAWEPAPQLTGPRVPAARLEAPAPAVAALPPAQATTTASPDAPPTSEGGDDESDLPF